MEYYDDKVCCQYHPGADLVEDPRAGDTICKECGLVVGDRVIDVGMEWRTYDNHEKPGNSSDPCRVGGPENHLMPNNLSTVIAGGSGAAAFDETGKAKYQSKSTASKADKRLIQAIQELEEMADRINLTQSIRDHAAEIYKSVRTMKTIKSRSNEAVAASCILIACRRETVPRTFKEICAVSNASKKELGKCFKLILKVTQSTVDLVKTEDLMDRFCANLGLCRMLIRVATNIARQAENLDLVPGRSPVSVTAAAIYMASQASQVKRSAKEVGDVCGVADVTIKQSYKLMFPKAAQLFPADFDFFTPIENLPQP